MVVGATMDLCPTQRKTRNALRPRRKIQTLGRRSEAEIGRQIKAIQSICHSKCPRHAPLTFVLQTIDSDAVMEERFIWPVRLRVQGTADLEDDARRYRQDCP